MIYVFTNHKQNLPLVQRSLNIADVFVLTWSSLSFWDINTNLFDLDLKWMRTKALKLSCCMPCIGIFCHAVHRRWKFHSNACVCHFFKDSWFRIKRSAIFGDFHIYWEGGFWFLGSAGQEHKFLDRHISGRTCILNKFF